MIETPADYRVLPFKTPSALSFVSTGVFLFLNLTFSTFTFNQYGVTLRKTLVRLRLYLHLHFGMLPQNLLILYKHLEVSLRTANNSRIESIKLSPTKLLLHKQHKL
jgi:hypothetical protein